ncbi:MAG: ribonuclease H-like domain-containing protein [Shimia thalassica]|uniref:ribonuclease H-like domain-containing protein n=1 Tax=Shimia thalassica TaxID=1715693 RepID=UPI003299A637
MDTQDNLPENYERKNVPSKLDAELSVCFEQPEKVVFLDIETTGLSHYYDEITIVGWSYGGKAHTLVKGGEPSELFHSLSDAVAIVTFNGIRFDQRFLVQEFPQIEIPPIHLDLMYLCRRVGLTGGQKKIEDELCLGFRDSLKDVDGFAAVLLWHEYLRGSKQSLEKLIRYNRADIAAMGAILDKVLMRLAYQHGLFTKHGNFVDWSAPDGWQKPPSDLKAASPEISTVKEFRDIFGSQPAAKTKIVGIDLTGSEAKPSGWCVLDGNIATTKTIAADQELISATVDVKPDIVSIDSPLCLPYGRLTVEDSDPTREEFGIMRQCERVLKRRGVNVYPSLLPSMQKLTARGIRLANIFRSKGIPVIESYPGAAQDIMRIPRKGAGIEWLKMGLSDFGILGEYLTENVTHDELDAITSALVGTFHLAGLSEGLGTEHEAPLVIPDLSAKELPQVIGVSGPLAAGKTTVAKVLEKEGYAYTRFSMAIDDLLRERGLPLDRKNRQAVGVEINQSGRQRELAERTIRKVADAQRIVVDGLRFPEDHAFLVEAFGLNFTHLYVDADVSERRLRYSKRLGTAESIGEKEFDTASSSEVEGRVGELRVLANQQFCNNVDLNDLESRLHNLFEQTIGE